MWAHRWDDSRNVCHPDTLSYLMGLYLPFELGILISSVSGMTSPYQNPLGHLPLLAHSPHSSQNEPLET